MRIVVCYYFRDLSISLGEDLAAALVNLGHDVHCFDSSARGSYMVHKRLAKSLAKLVGAKAQLSAYFSARQERQLAKDFLGFCEQIAPELIVVIRGERIPVDALPEVSSRFGAKTVVWWVKNPRWESRLFAEAESYDRAFSINESICGEGIQYLPSWSVNREVFSPTPFSLKKRQLLFIGTWSPRRQRYLEAIADLPLEIIGPHWLEHLSMMHPLRRKVAGEWVSPAGMASYYRSVWAVIDIHQMDQDHGQGVNMRFADVPTSGTVLITEPSREIERWQLADRCAVLFTNPESLRKAAMALLADAQRCGAMSGKTAEVSAGMPTFADRAATILQSLNRERSEV